MSKVHNKPPTPPTAGAGGTTGSVHTLYGVFINQNLMKFKGDIGNDIGVINSAIKSGQLNPTQSAEANKAMGALQKALADLGPGPGPLQPASGGWAGGSGSGGIHMMYGVFLRDALSNGRSAIQQTIADIQASKSGLSGTDLKEANAALKQLQSALKDLGSVQVPNMPEVSTQ